MEERVIIWRTYGETVVHPAALTFTLAAGIWLLFVRRDLAVLPVTLVACLIPIEQRIVVASLDFDMLRILILFGWARVLIKGEYRRFRRHAFDTILLLWLLFGTIAYVALARSVGSLVYRLGVTFEVCGVYFLMRVLLNRAADVIRALTALKWILLVVGAFMVLESLTGRNMFSVFGGVPELTVVRDGRLRCQGAFSHPIMAGSFGAGLAPVMTMLCFADKRHRALTIVALISACLIVVTSSSSGPALALVAGVFGCLLWLARKFLRSLWTATIVLLVVLHFVREQPVWHLIGRASDLIGGTGYHRVALISAFVDHWTEWFAMGVETTAHWGWGLQDVTNEFVLQGVRGGILTLIAFLAMLRLGFKAMGSVRKRAAFATHLPVVERRTLQLLAWGFGVSLASHCVSWISVSYFGQMTVIMSMLYAFIVTVDQTPELPRRRTRIRPVSGSQHHVS